MAAMTGADAPNARERNVREMLASMERERERGKRSVPLE
jgi:hypothetical protein